MLPAPIFLTCLTGLFVELAHGFEHGHLAHLLGTIRDLGTGTQTLRHLNPPTGLDRVRRSVDVNGVDIPDVDVIYTFDQRVDHTNTSRGTFKQRYFHTWEHYRPGGPIYLYTPGEGPLDTGLMMTNLTLVGALAQATNGAVVSIEHRFYGESQPFAKYTVEGLKLHTIDQALDDFVYFAQNFKSSMPGGDGEGVLPHKVPWIFVGGSHSGALGLWLLEQRPGVFWGAYSSSGTPKVQVGSDRYWSTIQQHMPANCSADFRAVIGRVDALIDANDEAGLSEIKTLFGLPRARNVDFVWALTHPVREWQKLDIAPRISALSKFYEFCDAIETLEDGRVSNSTDGWGLEIATRNLAKYLSGPEGYFETRCREDGNVPIDFCYMFNGNIITLSSIYYGATLRSWTWQICSELGWRFEGSPAGGGLVSKYFSMQAMADFCHAAFPGAFEDGSVAAFEARVRKTGERFKGYDSNAERVFVVNGRRDPWIGFTLSSPDIPHTITVSNRTNRPVYLTDGFHCSDLFAVNARADQGLQFVWDESVRTFQRWMGEFKPSDRPVDVSFGGGRQPNGTDNNAGISLRPYAPFMLIVTAGLVGGMMTT